MSCHRKLVLSALLVVLALVPAAARAAEPSPNPAGMQQLSEERTMTRWAYPDTRGAIYSRPTGQAQRIGRLRWFTEDRLPEIYIALASWSDEHGTPWVQIRVPKRPNGIVGWVPRSSLRSFTVVNTALELNRSTLMLTLTRGGQQIWSGHVGIGAKGTPTPTGHFYIREKFRVAGAPVYGPFALGTSAYAPHLTDWPGGGVVGLHGTNQPGLIPGRPSHGCIRLRNDKITSLYRLVPRGTPLWIHD
jgi:hypothetical protein